MNMPENTSPSSAPPARRRTSLRKVLGLLMAQSQEGPPDLEEMWRDFTRKLSSFFGLGKQAAAIRAATASSRTRAAPASAWALVR